MVLDTIVVNPSNAKYHFTTSDTAVMAGITVHSKDGTSYKAGPVFQVKDNRPEFIVDTVVSQNLAIAFTGFETARKIKLQVKESNSLMQYITLKAYNFPFINLLWAGVLIMVTGIIISISRRVQLNRSDREIVDELLSEKI
jgi:cytochrome c-type biogenesis protein CcmF